MFRISFWPIKSRIERISAPVYRNLLYTGGTLVKTYSIEILSPEKLYSCLISKELEFPHLTSNYKYQHRNKHIPRIYNKVIYQNHRYSSSKKRLKRHHYNDLLIKIRKSMEESNEKKKKKNSLGKESMHNINMMKNESKTLFDSDYNHKTSIQNQTETANISSVEQSSKPSYGTVIFIRHGETDFNSYNIFTGWYDVDLNTRGIQECQQAGYYLSAKGISFDIAFTSVLKRATKSLWHILDALDQTYIPIRQSWQLNERHYGALQGLSKTQTELEMGPITREYRSSWTLPPPSMESSHPHYNNIYGAKQYASIRENPGIPYGESLKMTSERVSEFWFEDILPHAMEGKTVLVVGHKNSLRSLFKIIDNISEDEIRDVKIPNGVPIKYCFDTRGNIVEDDQENNVFFDDNIQGLKARFLDDVLEDVLIEEDSYYR